MVVSGIGRPAAFYKEVGDGHPTLSCFVGSRPTDHTKEHIMEKKVSTSPERFKFQEEKYLERCATEGTEPRSDYIEMFRDSRDYHLRRFDDPKSRKDNLEYDLLTTDWILEKVRDNKVYAQNLYAAMCNREFQKRDLWPVLKDQRWSCSWRYAGGIIADMRQHGDYIDWYCSGIKGGTSILPDGEEQEGIPGYVGEGYVTEEIQNDLNKLGWMVIDDDTDLPI
ncbi:MAG: hypothetical protein EBT86_10160 [Actinobacteria bacterium]|nr:hypothetical protein [Actinomycetota bacterium]